MRILQLKLNTPNLETQKHFYSAILGLPLLQEDAYSFIIQAGRSQIQFVSHPQHSPYHFAFNIPCNQDAAALKWLKERVEIIPFEDEEIIDFNNWNAKAIYFFDQDQNIVEFIARKNLTNSVETPFGPAQILEVSEMGIACKDIHPIHQMLNTQFGIQIYDGNLKRFCAMGDEQGLFIIINLNQKKDWFPTKVIPAAADFEVLIVHSEGKTGFQYKEGLFSIQ